VLQCVAVCCRVSQCIAVCCSVLQCVAVCCSAAAHLDSKVSFENAPLLGRALLQKRPVDKGSLLIRERALYFSKKKICISAKEANKKKGSYSAPEGQKLLLASVCVCTHAHTHIGINTQPTPT